MSEYFRHHKSQSYQDEFVNSLVFHNRPGGTFLEFGARDGVTHSNTYFFETKLKWKGVLVEPTELEGAKLLQEGRRLRSKKILGAVCSRPGPRWFLSSSKPSLLGLTGFEDELKSSSLSKLRETAGFKRQQINCSLLTSFVAKRADGSQHLDFLSIDCEGCEQPVLDSLAIGEGPNQLSIGALLVEIPPTEDKRATLVRWAQRSGFLGPWCAKSDLVFVSKREAATAGISFTMSPDGLGARVTAFSPFGVACGICKRCKEGYTCGGHRIAFDPTPLLDSPEIMCLNRPY